MTEDEARVWAPLPPDRSAIPVLLYHGIGPDSDFSDPTDAAYGIDPESFEKQLTMIRYAGYRTVDLETFVDFVQGRPVDLPDRPLLLTFDDARRNSLTGADAVLKKLGFTAVMFVDVGSVERGREEYLTWPELAQMQSGGTWELQLHSGDGHRRIRVDPGPDDVGNYYAYRARGESFPEWRRRVRADISRAERTLKDHVPAFRPQAFAPPYGDYGQQGTNDERIPGDLLGWLEARYAVVFTQDVNARARPGDPNPLGRLQITRATAGGDIKHLLLQGGWDATTAGP